MSAPAARGELAFALVQLAYQFSNTGPINLYAQSEIAAASVINNVQCSPGRKVSDPASERPRVDFQADGYFGDAEISNQVAEQQEFKEGSFRWMMATFALPMPVSCAPEGSAHGQGHPRSLHQVAATINPESDRSSAIARFC